MCMWPLEYEIYVLSIFYVKLIMRVYEFSQWELFCSFVFIFEQVRIWSKSARGPLAMSVHPLVYGIGPLKELPEFLIRFTVLKCKRVQDIIIQTFDSGQLPYVYFCIQGQ